MSNIVIIEALRTAIGNFNGCYSKVTASKLGEVVIKELISRSGIESSQVSEVIMGQVLTASCGQNPARQSSVNAGIPEEVPAWTINQVCGSGLKSVALGMQSILSGQSEVVIAGGQENMSMAPHSLSLRSGVKMGEATLVDTMIKDGLWEAFNNYHMGVTAENLAKKFNISREDQDEFSYFSQNKAESAIKSGFFDNEIVPVTIPSRKGDTIVSKDEFPIFGTSIEKLSKLRAAFDKEGTVTAGNSSGINDGAAATLLMSSEKAEKLGCNPIARIVSVGQAGVDPKIMGIGPVYAVQKALKNAGWVIEDLDLIESNEAFAVQALSVNKELGWNTKIVNVNGGAIALGHPIGASGTRILVTLLHSMKRLNAKKGLATLCIGGGMGIAICVESLL